MGVWYGVREVGNYSSLPSRKTVLKIQVDGNTEGTNFKYT